jgi:[glutamine synthetase] adenylyltransferase / [glutamine synthetase]-adenylyl-L-tyrosine phosphorylase
MISSAKGDADQHCLAARFVDGPHVSAPDKAEQRLADWLTDLAPEQAAAVDDLAAGFPRAKTILLGIAEASPYLFDLVRADGGRAIRLLTSEPQAHLKHLIEKACRDVSAASSEADVMRVLRLAGDAGDGGADRSGGGLRAIGAALCVATGGGTRTAVAAAPGFPGGQ